MCALTLALLSACDLNETPHLLIYLKAKPFDAEVIACEDLSSPVLIQQLKSEWELSNTSNEPLDRRVQRIRKAADDGNVEIMLMYGYLLRMHDALQQYGLREFCSITPVDRGIIKTLPLDTKNNVVTGLSYFYASVDLIKNFPKSDRLEARKQMESSIYEGRVPPAWIAESKANAAQWHKHCAKQ
jgi:hypothetical protein